MKNTLWFDGGNPNEPEEDGEETQENGGGSQPTDPGSTEGPGK